VRKTFRWLATWQMDSPYDNEPPEYDDSLTEEEKENALENYISWQIDKEDYEEEVKRDLQIP
jgi:hypothetical protein